MKNRKFKIPSRSTIQTVSINGRKFIPLDDAPESRMTLRPGTLLTAAFRSPHCSRRTVPSFDPPGYPLVRRTRVGSVIRVCEYFRRTGSYLDIAKHTVDHFSDGMPVVHNLPVRSWVLVTP